MKDKNYALYGFKIGEHGAMCFVWASSVEEAKHIMLEERNATNPRAKMTMADIDASCKFAYVK